MRASKVEFDESSARDYEFTHGHRPRGTGTWSFTLHRFGSSTRQEFTGAYSDCKRQAMQLARKLRCTDVTVDT